MSEQELREALERLSDASEGHGEWLLGWQAGIEAAKEIALAARDAHVEPLDVETLRALSEAATPGPWSADVMYVVGRVRGGRPTGEVIGESKPTVDRLRYLWREQGPKDAAFIVAAVNFVRARLRAGATPEGER